MNNVFRRIKLLPWGWLLFETVVIVFLLFIYFEIYGDIPHPAILAIPAVIGVILLILSSTLIKDVSRGKKFRQWGWLLLAAPFLFFLLVIGYLAVLCGLGVCA